MIRGHSCTGGSEGKQELSFSRTFDAVFGEGGRDNKGLFFRRRRLFFAMSKIEEIEQAVEQLPLNDFVKLAVWVDQRRQQLEIFPSSTDKSQGAARDHSAFLTSYAPQDEGLYDDAATR
jgi:hypothetical protein